MNYDSTRASLEKETDKLTAMPMLERWNFLCQYKVSDIVRISSVVDSAFRIKPDEKKVKYYSIAHKCGEAINYVFRGIAGKDVPIRTCLLGVKEAPNGFDRRYTLSLRKNVDSPILGYIVFETEPCEVEPLMNSPRAVTTGTRVTSVKTYDTRMQEHNFTIGELLDAVGCRKEYIVQRMIISAVSDIDRTVRLKYDDYTDKMAELQQVTDAICSTARGLHDAVIKISEQ